MTDQCVGRHVKTTDVHLGYVEEQTAAQTGHRPPIRKPKIAGRKVRKLLKWRAAPDDDEHYVHAIAL